MKSKLKKAVVYSVILIAIILNIKIWSFLWVTIFPGHMSFDETENEIRGLAIETEPIIKGITEDAFDYADGYISKSRFKMKMVEYRDKIDELQERCDKIRRKAHPEFEECIEYYCEGLASWWLACNSVKHDKMLEAIDYIKDGTTCFELASQELNDVIEFN